MVKISHYEVYTDRGDGWKLEDRFSSDQRYEAIRVAKEKEQEKIAVKILKEDFDIQDNSYVETIEYVSGLSNKKDKSRGNMINDFQGKESSPKIDYTIETQVSSEAPAGQNVFTAIFKLVAIIVFCLVSANILITLLVPVIEILVPKEMTQTIMFVVFFAIFILFAVPLVLRKVPWYVFSSRKSNRKKIIHEKKFFDKADAIIQIYNLNDKNETSMAPAFPEAPAEFKRYVVDYLSQIISHLDQEVTLTDNFSRLGIKLIIYGGVLELSRYNGLGITHANSMLHESFGILDGDIADVEAFYDAKKTYKDNKVAIFLTGVGAYLMSQLLGDRPLDTHILKATFVKWNSLNNYEAADNRKSLAPEIREKDILLKCIVGIENRIRYYDGEQPQKRDDFAIVKNEIHNIMTNLASKFHGGNVVEDNYIISIEFEKLNNAARFAVEFFKDVSIYEEQMNNSNLIIANRCSIFSLTAAEEPNLSLFIQDILEQTYDNEIIVNEPVKENLPKEAYSFEFLGDKKLNKTGYSTALYKLIEQ